MRRASEYATFETKSAQISTSSCSSVYAGVGHCEKKIVAGASSSDRIDPRRLSFCFAEASSSANNELLFLTLTLWCVLSRTILWAAMRQMSQACLIRCQQTVIQSNVGEWSNVSLQSWQPYLPISVAVRHSKQSKPAVVCLGVERAQSRR